MVTPPYSGLSFRTYFQYDGPSLIDGIHLEHNVQDNLLDVWFEYAYVEAAIEDFISSTHNA